MRQSTIKERHDGVALGRGNERSMTQKWEYRKIDLGSHAAKEGDLQLLGAAGWDGWELLSITSNNMAYLKRRRVAQATRRGTTDGVHASRPKPSSQSR